MMSDAEIASFVNKFLHMLNTGKKARLVLHCEAMKAEVSLDVQLPAHPQEEHLHQRAAGPSRVRRRHDRRGQRAVAARFSDRADHPPPQHAAGRAGPFRLR